MKRTFTKYLLVAIFIFHQCSIACASFYGPEEPDIRVIRTHIIRTHTPYEICVSESDQPEEEQNTRDTVRGVLSMIREAVPEVVSALQARKIVIYPHKEEFGARPNAHYNPPTNSLVFNVTRNGWRYGWRLVRTCRSKQIIAHETGHLVSHALRPDLCGPCRAQTGAFDESFGDLIAILYELWNPVSVHRGIDRLTDKSASLGDDAGIPIREMHHNRTLENNQSCEIHDLSQPFTGAVYDAIKTEFFESTEQYFFYNCFFPKQPFQQLYRNTARGLAKDFTRILVGSVINAQGTRPSFGDMALSMLEIAGPYYHRLGSCFVKRGILKPNPCKNPYCRTNYIKGDRDNTCDPNSERTVSKPAFGLVSTDGLYLSTSLGQR